MVFRSDNNPHTKDWQAHIRNDYSPMDSWKMAQSYHYSSTITAVNISSYLLLASFTAVNTNSSPPAPHLHTGIDFPELDRATNVLRDSMYHVLYALQVMYHLSQWSLTECK